MKKAVIFITVILFFILDSLLYKYSLYISSGLSMYPHIDSGNVLLIQKNNTFQRGDVIAYKDRGVTQVKRAVCMPGDTVLIRSGILECGDITIQDPRMDPPIGSQYGPYPIPKEGDQVISEYISHSVYSRVTKDGKEEELSVTASQDFLFVVGDNYGVSIDSRHAGAVPVGNVLGKVVYVW